MRVFMWYSIEVKTDNQKAWRKLSVKMRSFEALKNDLHSYIVMYAQDMQVNHGTISARIIDENRQVIYTRLSNAQSNKV